MKNGRWFRCRLALALVGAGVLGSAACANRGMESPNDPFPAGLATGEAGGGGSAAAGGAGAGGAGDIASTGGATGGSSLTGAGGTNAGGSGGVGPAGQAGGAGSGGAMTGAGGSGSGGAAGQAGGGGVSGSTGGAGSAMGGTVGAGGMVATGGMVGTGGTVGMGGMGGTGGAGPGGTGGTNAGGQAGSTPADAAQYNFESGTQAWDTSGAPVTTVASSTTEHFAGTHALAVTVSGAAGTANAAVLSPATPAGKVVTFHIWIPSASAISALQPFVLQDATGNWTWTGNWQAIGSLNAGAWNTLTVTVPANAALPLAQLGVQVTTGATWTGTLYVDSVSW